MSYRIIDELTNNAIFGGRVRACAIEQAAHFRNDERPPIVALAQDMIRGTPEAVAVFIRLAAAAPGHADQAGLGDTVDESAITDSDLLAVIQGSWPMVAELYFDDEGNRKELGT